MEHSTRELAHDLAERRTRFAADPMPAGCQNCGGWLTRGAYHLEVGRWLCLDCVATAVGR